MDWLTSGQIGFDIALLGGWIFTLVLQRRDHQMILDLHTRQDVIERQHQAFAEMVQNSVNIAMVPMRESVQHMDDRCTKMHGLLVTLSAIKAREP